MSDEDDKTTELPLGKEAEANLFKSRSIFIYGGITQELAHKVCAQLAALAAASDDDIRIFVNSPGGHVESGDSIHDMIGFIKPKVWIIGTGWVASAGALIYVSVPKEQLIRTVMLRVYWKVPISPVPSSFVAGLYLRCCARVTEQTLSAGGDSKRCAGPGSAVPTCCLQLSFLKRISSSWRH